MGNTKSLSCMQNPSLALVAVARKLKLQRYQVVVIRETLRTFTDAQGYVDKQSFGQALKSAKVKNKQDLEIFELLFTLWDGRGEEKIPATPFSVGISPLACPRDELLSVLRFCLHVSDDRSSGTIGAQELRDMLCAIDMTAFYFGDEQLETEEIDNVIESVFDHGDFPITHEMCARKLKANAYIKRFVSGKIRSRVQFKEQLTVVTEFGKKPDCQYVVEKESDCTSPVAVIDQIVKDNLWLLELDEIGPCAPVKPRRMASLLDSTGSFESNASLVDPPSIFSFVSSPKALPRSLGRRDPPAFAMRALRH